MNAQPIYRLTPRQLEVLELLAKGLTNPEIGRVLGISAGTAKLHVSAVLDALEVTNRTEAAVALQSLRANEEETEHPVPGFGSRPAIVVLPFDNLSPDPAHEFFADALVEDLTTQLACLRWFPVIARNSAVAMRGRNVTHVGRELGARYVIEGSTRAAGEHVRIQLQLIRADTGEHLFARRYDRELRDVFAVQDEIVEAIVGVLEPVLLGVEGLRALRKPAGSLDAWGQAQRGISLLQTQAIEETEAALGHFDRAIEFDPTFALGHGGRAAAQLLRGVALLGAARPSSMEPEALQTAVKEATRCFFEALSAGRRATELDPFDATAFLGLAGGLFMTGQRETAMAAYDRALELNPNSALVCLMTGIALGWDDRWREAGPLFERALRLSPHDPALHHIEASLAGVRFREEKYDDALSWARSSVGHEPGGALSHRPFIPASLAFLGRLDEARRESEKLRAFVPDWNAQLARLLGPPELIEPLLEGMRLAGWDFGDE